MGPAWGGHWFVACRSPPGGPAAEVLDYFADQFAPHVSGSDAIQVGVLLGGGRAFRTLRDYFGENGARDLRGRCRLAPA